MKPFRIRDKITDQYGYAIGILKYDMVDHTCMLCILDDGTIIQRYIYQIIVTEEGIQSIKSK